LQSKIAPSLLFGERGRESEVGLGVRSVGDGSSLTDDQASLITLVGNDVKVEWSDGHVTTIEWRLLRERLREADGGEAGVEVVGEKDPAALAPASWVSPALPTSVTERGGLWHTALTLDDITVDLEYRPDADVDDLTVFYHMLRSRGVAAIRGVEPTAAATEAAIRHLGGGIQSTLWGTYWEFEADESADDFAYTTDALGVHTDGTYLGDTPGLQVFHCLDFSGDPATDGNTLLADGWAAAERVRRTVSPAAWRALTTHRVTGCFADRAGADYRSTSPILTLDPETGRGVQTIRFNHEDRLPVTGTSVAIRDFYEGLGTLYRELSDPTVQIRAPLLPGTLLFINNWRVLHGRTSFPGGIRRRLGGAYVGMDDILSKFRQAGVW
jgi:alpha-ketoglutarate-dependent taurine dioxygenase